MRYWNGMELHRLQAFGIRVILDALLEYPSKDIIVENDRIFFTSEMSGTDTRVAIKWMGKKPLPICLKTCIDRIRAIGDELNDPSYCDLLDRLSEKDILMEVLDETSKG